MTTSGVAAGYEIAGLSSRIGIDTLHHGPILVTLEATALDLASSSIAETGDPLGPGNAHDPGALAVDGACDGDTLLVRTELVDHGHDDGVIAVGFHRLRRRTG